MGRLAYIAAVAAVAWGLSGCAFLQPSDPGPDVETLSTEPATKEEIREIQTLLADRGYRPGPADGIMGPRTSAAIRHYQTEADLEPTGEATKGLLARLRDTATGPGRRPPRRRSEPAETAPVDLGTPAYRPGDTFVYSGGVSFTVLRVGADRVIWRDSRGDSFTAPIAVALPQIEWKYGAWRGRNDVRRDAVASWPPGKGAELSFDVRAEEWNIENGPGDERNVTDIRWSCRNEGLTETEVPAGSFETTVIACDRSPAPAGLWQRRVWHYAPSIGHYVQREDRDGSGIETERIELVAAIPGTEGWPPAVRSGLKMAMEAALSEKGVGEQTVWSSTAVDDRFTIRITNERRILTGQICRNYVIVRAVDGVRRLYPAIACRSPRGKTWSTPGFDGGVIGLAPGSASSG